MSKYELESIILDELAEQLRETEDFEILAVMACQIGWTSVRLTYNESRTWYEVKIWAEENCPSDKQEHHGHWIFKDPAEATWFKMRWA